MWGVIRKSAAKKCCSAAITQEPKLLINHKLLFSIKEKDIMEKSEDGGYEKADISKSCLTDQLAWVR